MGEEGLPEEVAAEARRLTRHARDAVDDAAAAAYRERRDELLAEHGFLARYRADDDTLVCYPEEWVVDGEVRIGRVEDTDRALELPLSGAGEDGWEAVEAHNAALVDAVAEAHGEVHAANARAFADFMGNHYARRVETAGADEMAEFLTEYYPRNAWPTDEQRAVVEESLELLFEAADATLPPRRG